MNRRSFLRAAPVAGAVIAAPALAARLIPDDLAMALVDYKTKYKALSVAWEAYEANPRKSPINPSAEYDAYWNAKHACERAQAHFMELMTV